jgi:hypothetical protein
MHQLCRRLKGGKEERGMSCDEPNRKSGQASPGQRPQRRESYVVLLLDGWNWRDIYYLGPASVRDN